MSINSTPNYSEDIPGRIPGTQRQRALHYAGQARILLTAAVGYGQLLAEVLGEAQNAPPAGAADGTVDEELYNTLRGHDSTLRDAQHCLLAYPLPADETQVQQEQEQQQGDDAAAPGWNVSEPRGSVISAAVDRAFKRALENPGVTITEEFTPLAGRIQITALPDKELNRAQATVSFPKNEAVSTRDGFIQDVQALRAQMGESQGQLEQMKHRLDFTVTKEQQGEVLRNLSLARTHLEDSRMRLGKVLQYIGDGVSIYDKGLTQAGETA